MFNNEQKIAIEHKKGPMIVLAGPGSGKTTVVTHRVKWLMNVAGVSPANILIVTFTKAAAVEMKERFLKLMGGQRMATNFGTFHSVFFTILKYAYGYTHQQIIAEDQKYQLIRTIIDQLDLELDDEKEFIPEVLNEISLVKGSLISLDYYYSTSCSEDIFRKVYTLYQNKLKEQGLIDFDDMLVDTYELFKARADILKQWQQKFQYILIDEFQDINQVQYEIIKMLALPENNLFIVGDDDQSIYKFRGAKPEIMLNFKKDYPDAQTVLLATNYRCSEKIVKGALCLINNNQERYQKSLNAYHHAGEHIHIKLYENIWDQYEAIIKSIQEYHFEQQIPLNEIAILYRTNHLAGFLLEKLMEFNLPFKTKDSIPNIYNHWISKTVISYIKMALSQGEKMDLINIANRPNRYISRQNFSLIPLSLEQIKVANMDKGWLVKNIDQLIDDLAVLKDLAPSQGISYIKEAIDYEGYLKEYASRRKMNPEDLLEILDELLERAKNYQTYEEWFDHIEAYGEELLALAKKSKENLVDSIELLTAHSSKGLEYQVVFLIDVNEGIFPHRKALTGRDIEEERRLFYVAMTRAKRHLHIYSTKFRFEKQMTVSRFVSEVLLDTSQLESGVEIYHKVYGQGKILKIEGKFFWVNFAKEIGRKKLDITYCITHELIRSVE